MKQTIYVDAHVHIYDCFNLDTFFTSAHKNFLRFSRDDTAPKKIYFLLLTESSRHNWFNILKNDASKNPGYLENWVINKTSENITIVAQNKTNPSNKLFLVSGRQIVTAEKIEVLALFTNQFFEDGVSLTHTVKKIGEVGGIPVIPWGAGKWFGKRGKTLRDFIKSNKEILLFLGDNEGRPTLWPTPSLFKIGHKKSRQVLPGSDPLPLISSQKRAGRYGFFFHTKKDALELTEQIKEYLHSNPINIPSFGCRQNLYTFFKTQISRKLNCH